METRLGPYRGRALFRLTLTFLFIVAQENRKKKADEIISDIGNHGKWTKFNVKSERYGVSYDSRCVFL